MSIHIGCFLTHFSFSLSFVSFVSSKNCSLFTSTTWSWSAGHINLSTKATSSCLTRSWSQCGQLLTTAIAAATSPPLWSSKMLTQESQSSSEQYPTQKESFHPEQQHLISCKHIKTKTTQPFIQCKDTDWDSGISTCEPLWILYSEFRLCSVHFLVPTVNCSSQSVHIMPLFCSLKHTKT